MWTRVCGSEAKEDDFVAWLSRLLKENQPFMFLDANQQEVAFVNQASIKLIYEVLHLRDTHNIEFQDFLALMQQAGEEMGLMSVQEEKQDNYVVLAVIQSFAKNFIQGFSRLMTEIGFY